MTVEEEEEEEEEDLFVFNDTIEGPRSRFPTCRLPTLSVAGCKSATGLFKLGDIEWAEGGAGGRGIRKKHAKNSYHIWYEMVYKRYEIILISMCGMMTYHFFSFHTTPNVVHTRCILFHTT